MIKERGSPEAALEGLCYDSFWERDLDCALKEKISLLSFFDPHYPNSLKQLADAPLILYVKGTLLASDSASLGIVGTRQCSLYGQEMTGKIAQEIALAKLTVVSGLARGIDTAAHLGALKTGRTLALIGSGLSHIYPRENKVLAERIAEQGAVISELSMHTPPERRHFPRRNRLVSALSQGVLLAEAPIKSGAMITMEMAHFQKKMCFSLPGRADSESFRGNHFLIKEKKALLVENCADMLSLLGYPNPSSVYSAADDLDLEEKELMTLLPSEEITIEELSLRTNLPIAKLSSLLMGLVLKQAVREFPGKFYKKVP